MAEQLVVLSNEYLEVKVSTKGAELQSIKYGGKEKLWQGDTSYWLGHAPILFPICGGLKEEKYTFEGKEYTLPKHGFVRFSEFEVECSEKEKAIFLLCSDKESKKHFPFDYELRITYSLSGSELNVKYDVKNLSHKEMYFSIGAHEGYACPEGIEAYSIIFDEVENLDSNVLNGELLEYNTVNVGKNTNELPLKYDYFLVDALVFLNLKSKMVKLKNRITNEVVTLEFKDHDYFLLWTKPGAKYICMEPWCGIQDFVDSDFDITKKRGVIKLLANEVCTKVHRIIF